MKRITRKQTIKNLENQLRVARKWQDAGYNLEVIREGLWNKMAANCQVRNEKLEIWGSLPEDAENAPEKNQVIFTLNWDGEVGINL